MKLWENNIETKEMRYSAGAVRLMYSDTSDTRYVVDVGPRIAQGQCMVRECESSQLHMERT